MRPLREHLPHGGGYNRRIELLGCPLSPLPLGEGRARERVGRVAYLERQQVDKITNILFVGVGGQGVLKASDVLARAAFLDGAAVKKSEIHGMSQRGGGVTSTVRYGKVIHSPLAPSKSIDFLVALDKPEGEKYLPELADGGKALFIDEKLLGQLGDARVANIALLGVLSTSLDIPEAAWEKAIAVEMAPKHVAMNVEAFKIGRTLAGKNGARQ
jgi:indolepyruvate ferredoxin oxidoreductase, beta subunit